MVVGMGGGGTVRCQIWDFSGVVVWPWVRCSCSDGFRCGCGGHDGSIDFVTSNWTRDLKIVTVS